MDLSRRFNIAALAFIFLVFLITVYLTKDFLTTILASVVLVFLLRPVYAIIYRITKRGQISSLFSLLIVFIFILAFLLSLTTVLLVEISNLQRSGAISNIEFSTITHEIDLLVQEKLPLWLYNYIDEIVLRYVHEIGDIPATIATWLFPIVQRELSSFASNLPGLFAQLVVVIFFTYYILIDGNVFLSQAVNLLPKQKRSMVRYFLQELDSIYTTLFTVYFSTSMLSGVLAAIGFSLLGIHYPFVLGAVVGVFTLLPMLGPPFIFVPMALYYLLMGDWTMSLIILLFGTVVLMVIPENVIRPHLAMKGSRIHPILTLLAYTAPIFVVGIVGVIIGPTLYGFLLASYRSLVHFQEI
jgi:predicted PurR-regulated permease PerM